MPDIAIIGGGAAGFFAAVNAKITYPQTTVTIFEKSNRVLAKVLISGGGRCNLTNSFAQVKDLKHVYPRGDKLIKRLFKVFDHHDTYQWFEEQGVPLVTQDDECIFPKSQRATSIADCLIRKALQSGVKIRTGYTLERLTPLPDSRIKATFRSGTTAVFNKVIIATGGSPRAEKLSYLADLGHTIVAPVPSLFTFEAYYQTSQYRRFTYHALGNERTCYIETLFICSPLHQRATLLLQCSRQLAQRDQCRNDSRTIVDPCCNSPEETTQQYSSRQPLSPSLAVSFAESIARQRKTMG